jgi:hypothetical protein
MCLSQIVASQSLQKTNLGGGGGQVETLLVYPHAIKTILEGLGICLPFLSTFHDFEDDWKEIGPS